MKNFNIRLILFAALIFSLCSCTTLFRSGKKPVFLFMNKETERTTKFYIDGKQKEPKYIEYSRSEVARSSSSVTYEITMLPALLLKPGKMYYTLKVDNPTGTKEILLKRDLMWGYKAMLYIDMYFTVGVGTVIDIFSNSLYGYPSLDVDLVKNSAQKQFYSVGTKR